MELTTNNYPDFTATEIHRLENHPAEAARELCCNCGRLIGDAEYTVDACAIIKHYECPTGRL